MEKRGVIEAGVTPPEQTVSPPAAVPGMLVPNTAVEKQAYVQDLDNDFRKRAAEAARTAIN